MLLMAQGRWREAAQELQTAHGQQPSRPEIDAQLQRAQGHAAAELLRRATLHPSLDSERGLRSRQPNSAAGSSSRNSPSQGS